MFLLFLASAPVFILLIFIYLKDKYEREPIKLVLKTMFLGMLTPIPVIIVDWLLAAIKPTGMPHFGNVFFESFISAALVEEFFKFLVIMLFIWRHEEFDEEFDGIVYAMFASMGFALVENFLYVFSNGVSVGITRTFTAVPAHAMFAISMGYFLGLAKFNSNNRTLYIIIALFSAVILHGSYDFILMSEKTFLLLLFIPLMILMLFLSFKLIKKHSENSKYNPKNKQI